MRITHLILTRHFAGSERHAVELANAQAREHDVSLVLRRGAAGWRNGVWQIVGDAYLRLFV